MNLVRHTLHTSLAINEGLALSQPMKLCVDCTVIECNKWIEHFLQNMT